MMKLFRLVKLFKQEFALDIEAPQPPKGGDESVCILALNFIFDLVFKVVFKIIFKVECKNAGTFVSPFRGLEGFNIKGKFFILFVVAVLLSSCQETTTKTEETKVVKPQTKTQICTPKGKVLDHNQKLIKDQNLLVCITADSTTHDQQFGDSHRVLEIYDTRTCEIINREVLPVNLSPDFPYYIADIIFNKNSHLIAIKGFGNLYCYDAKGRKLLEPLVPEFVNDRVAQDAQSGQVKHLEVWENYLIGYASDLGSFVFDLSDVENPKALQPAAEYDLSGGEGEIFSSLFFLKSENENTYQVIVPFYDNEEMKFHVNPLFESPEYVSPFIPKKNRADKIIVIHLQEKPSRPIVVDMSNHDHFKLPEDVKMKSTLEIVNWLEKNTK